MKTDDQLNENLDAAGRAIGFAVTAMLLELSPTRLDKARFRTFADNLDALFEGERFSPDAATVISAFAHGVRMCLLAGTNDELV